MPDRERVIKALACCVFPVSKGFPYQSHIADQGCEVVECPYKGDCDQMLLDALELLKEQDSVRPIRVQREELLEENEVSTVTDVWAEWYCPKCHKKIAERYSPHAPYCMWCGQAVTWDE